MQHEKVQIFDIRINQELGRVKYYPRLRLEQPGDEIILVGEFKPETARESLYKFVKHHGWKVETYTLDGGRRMVVKRLA